MSVKAYVAAPYELKDYASRVASLLAGAGILVTSRWMTEGQNETNDVARMDLDDIDEADVVVLVNPGDWARKGTGGRHFECGYALKGGKALVVLGSLTNLFHRLDTVRHAPTEEHLVKEVELAVEGPRYAS